jgi:hypothetical protein
MSIPPGRREPESVAQVRAAPLGASAFATEGMRQAGAHDDRFGAEFVAETARAAVAAWAMAVDGDGEALAAIASPDTVYWLLNPVRKPWRVAPGPRVTGIGISGLDVEKDPPELLFSFRFEGRMRFADSGSGQADGAAEGETIFVGVLRMTLPGSGPWHLSSGHVSTLDEHLGYVFTSRRESPEEYRERAGPGSSGAAAAGRGYLIVAGFAEHDERFGARAEIEVRRETAPTREEAEALIWPVIDEVTAAALGEGDWRPSMNWLDVIELLDEPPEA